MKLSVQLYTVRDQFSADPEGTLKKLKEMGLNYVEGGGSFGGDSAEDGKKLLDSLGLKANGAHIGLDAFKNDFDKVISDAKTIGVNYVIVPWIGEDVYKDGWDKFGLLLNEIGKKVKDAGLVLCYHNHAFEFEKNGFDTLFATADKDLVKSQLDIAWVQIGGADPAAKVTELLDRLPLVHLKDFDPSKTPQWRPGGQGIVDWDGVLAAINKGNVEFGSIELDESLGDPMEAVAQSVEFFRSKGVSE